MAISTNRKLLLAMYNSINDAIELVAEWGPDVLSPEEVMEKYMYPTIRKLNIAEEDIPKKWRKGYSSWVATKSDA